LVKLNPSHEHIDKHPEWEGQTENDIYYFNYICSKSNHNDCVLFQQNMSKQLGLSCFFKQAPASQKRHNNMENLYAAIALSHFLLRGFQFMYWITKVMEIGKGCPLPSMDELKSVIKMLMHLLKNLGTVDGNTRLGPTTQRVLEEYGEPNSEIVVNIDCLKIICEECPDMWKIRDVQLIDPNAVEYFTDLDSMQCKKGDKV
jgi:hypothetical protein